MTEKEKWITEVQDSLNGIELPEVNPYLYDKVLNRINFKTTEYVSRKIVFASVFSFAVLITINLLIFTSFGRNSGKPGNDLVKISKAFYLVNENDINYN